LDLTGKTRNAVIVKVWGYLGVLSTTESLDLSLLLLDITGVLRLRLNSRYNAGLRLTLQDLV
jgi:hypothetical protein